MKLKLTFVLAGVALLVVGLSSVAFAAGGLTGTYTTTIKSPAELKGKWALKLATGGQYTVVWNGRSAARGKYTSTAQTITFVRETGSPCKGSGTYAWKRSGKTMTFVRKKESASCQARATVLAHRFTLVR